jgi:hypothetical protein
MDNKTVTVYMCGTDWQWEVGEASDGNKIYPSVDELLEYCKCAAGCGIVECKITFSKWVQEPLPFNARIQKDEQ